MMIQEKKTRYSLRSLKENVGTVAKLVIKQLNVSQNTVKMRKMMFVCNYCKRPGHVKANCFKLMKKNLGERNSIGTGNGVAGTADCYFLQ